jgi:multiple sugar transport system substrate-binding protein
MLSVSTVHAQDQIVIRTAVVPPELSYHQQIAALYMAKHPNVKIEYSAPPGDYPELLQETLRDNLTNNPIDLGFFGNYTVPALIDRGLAVPVTDFIASEHDWASLGYSDNMMSISEYGRVQYGVPFEITLPVVYYNTTLVKAAGGDVTKLPTDWDGILALAAKISALGPDTAGLFMRMDDTWMFQALLFAQGGSLLSTDGTKIAFDGPEGRNALDLFDKLGKVAHMPALTHGQARQLFAAGHLGILVSSGAIARGLLAGAQGNFDIVAAGFPGIGNKSRLPAGGNAAVIVSPDKSKYPAIWDYVKFATGPEAQTIMAKATGFFPVNNLAVDRPDLLGDFYVQNPVFAAGIAQRNLATKWYSFPGPNGVEIDQSITQTLIDLIQGRVQANEAMHRMVEQANAKL